MAGTRSARIGGTNNTRIHLPGAATEYADRVAVTGFRSGLFTLFDPERPEEDPNALLGRMQGREHDPNAMKHHCPMCCHSVTAAGCEAEAMEWAVFRAHLRKCYIDNRLTKLDITHRKFAGASVADAGRVTHA
jgi:hypothetical protein